MFRFSLALVLADAQKIWQTPGQGVTQFKAVSANSLKFGLSSLELQDQIDGVSVHVPGWSQLEIAGEPDLPVMRTSMILPQGADIDQVELVLSDVVVDTVQLSEWGSQVSPSKGKCPLCGPCNATTRSESAYNSIYPKSSMVSVSLVNVWRDVQYVDVEVKPVAVNHGKGIAEVMRSCSIKLVGVGDSVSTKSLGVETSFYEAYKFFFSNWQHFEHEYSANAQPGRVLVVYDSALQSQANTYKNIVQERLNPKDIIMYEAGRSSSAVQDKIRSLYQEGDKLAYVTIIGRDVPSPTGSQTRTACDNCYVMLSGGTDLDIPIGRISGDSSGVSSYLSKLQKYDSNDNAPWTKKAYGTYSMVMQDERAMDQKLQQIFQASGWSFDYKQDTRTDESESASMMESGLGVFSYIGHGSGTAWNTPRFSVSQVQSLSNEDKIFFELDVSCDNGDFQSHRPCMGEALITSRGGAIGTMMSSPTMKGTMCKRQQEQAATALTTGTAYRIGNIYNIGLMKGNQITRDAYAMQAYNVFGDPTQAIKGAAPPSPTPTPTPTPTPAPTPVPPPTPTPSPSPGSCHAISPVVDDDWCVANCAAGFCPSDLCECDQVLV